MSRDYKAKDLPTKRLTLRIALGDGGWHKTAVIPLSGVVIRQICQAYPSEFLGNTQLGYRLAEYAEPEEVSWAIASLRSRARKITRRADALEDAYPNRGQAEFFF